MALDSILLQVSLTCPRCHQPLHVQGLTTAAYCASCSHGARVPEPVWSEWFCVDALLKVLDDIDTAPGIRREVYAALRDADLSDVADVRARLERLRAQIEADVADALDVSNVFDEVEDDEHDDDEDDDDDDEEDLDDADDDDDDGLEDLDAGTFAPEIAAARLQAAIESPRLHAVQSVVDGLEARYQFGASPAHCVKCKAPAPVDGLEAAAAAGGYACGCGERVAVRPADALARRLVPNARFVVGEGPLGADDEPVATREPVLFQCMGCGGSLSVDGRSRNVRCTFCGSANYLPDGLWLRLHPPRIIRPFFVVAALMEGGHLTEDTLAFLGRSDSWKARQKAARRTSDPKLLAALAGDSDSDVRKAVASNTSASVETLAALAKDGSYHVRCIVAQNGSAPPEVLAVLIKDQDSDVRKAVKGNPNLSVDILALLLTDGSYEVRKMAVSDERIPPDRLVELARKEHDSDVLQALLARKDLTPDVLVALAHNRDSKAFRGVAADPRLPLEGLRKLATLRDSDARKRVSERPDLPEEVLLELFRKSVRESDTKLLKKLLKRPALPLEALELGKAYPDEGVVKAAQEHPVWVAHVSAGRRRKAFVAAGVGAVITCLGVLGTGGVGVLFVLRKLFRILS